MKIRIAINSDFVLRKLRCAAYGMLLLLTFFVPQFAKTQDQLNAAKQAQAASRDIALEQNQVGGSVDKSNGVYAAITPGFDSAQAQTNLIFAEEKPVSVGIPSLLTPSIMTATPAGSQPVLIASLPQTAFSTVDAPAQETVRFSPTQIININKVGQTVPPVMIASLTPSILPAAAQSIAESGLRFTGEYIDAEFVNVPLADFFRMMADIGGINIILDPAINGNISGLKVEKLPWDQLFDAVLLAHSLDKTVEGNLVRVALKSTLQEEVKQLEALKNASIMAGDLESRVKRLNYAKSEEMRGLVADRLSARGTVVVDGRTNSLILLDLPEYIDKLVKLIDSLDIPQPQVEIETRIVAATRNFTRDIGVQFGFVQGNSQRVTVGGSNTSYLQPNAKRPMGESSSSSESPGVSPGIGDSTGNLNVNLPARTPFGGIGLAIGNIFDTFLLDAAITAGENKGTAKLISQPKVVVQNNSPAVINNGVRFPVQVISDNTVSIQFFDAALTLTATPQITFDNNIHLDLAVTNNRADFGRAVNGTPTILTSEATTRILVSNGGTTMLGGIVVEDDSSNEDRIPGLGSLPILGHLFRRTGSSRETQEILFFVTPRIVR